MAAATFLKLNWSICHQLKIRHLYGTFDFSTQCNLYGDRKLVCLAPSTKHNRICGHENCAEKCPYLQLGYQWLQSVPVPWPELVVLEPASIAVAAAVVAVVVVLQLVAPVDTRPVAREGRTVAAECRVAARMAGTVAVVELQVAPVAVGMPVAGFREIMKELSYNNVATTY